MATTQFALDRVLDLLSELDDVSCRGMMGEFLLYYRGKVFGGVYDGRFLLKPVKSALSALPGAKKISPYPGAKEMLLVEDTVGKIFVRDLVISMYPDLPFPKKKK